MDTQGQPDGTNGPRRENTFAEASLSTDVILHLLAPPRRRTLLRYLVEQANPVCDLNDCVGYLVEQSDDRRSRSQVEVALHHVEVPRLVEAGLIEYDPRTGQIRYRGNTELEAMLLTIGRD